MIFLSNDETNLMGETAKSLRPADLDKKDLYSSEAEDKIQLFIVSFNFLSNLNSKIKNENINKKIEKALKDQKEAYDEAFYLFERFSRSTITKHRVIEKMGEFLVENYRDVFALINFVMPLGKRVMMYDPEEHGGIID